MSVETMTELLTAAQMRAIEQAAIDSGEVTGLELMERAGQGVVDAIVAEWPELGRVGETHRAVVLCGPGNNGGDGFVVARLLKEAGWEVEVFFYGDAEKLPPDAKANYKRWNDTGKIKELTDDEIDGYGEDNPGTAIAIDAIFGSGLSRPFVDLGRVQDELNYWRCGNANVDLPRVVAIDVPSGMNADTSFYLGYERENPFDMCIVANLTVTFHRPFVGHYIGMGPSACGTLRSVPIGLENGDPSNETHEDRVSVISYAKAGLSVYDKRLNKYSPGHKYGHGHAFILSGGVGKGGAARLAARAALRIGAGVVTVGCPPAALIENAAQLNAIMLARIKDVAMLLEVLRDSRINALCIGPGLGLSDTEAGLLRTTLETTRPGLDPGPQTGGKGGGPGSSPGRGLVLDADALTLLGQDNTLFEQLHAGCILTPHAGEFARLFPDIAEKLNAPAIKGPAYSKVDATRDAAKRAGCVVLFKGPDTVIADPSGRCSINASVYERSAPWLATAGSGDVLAGFITGLLARGYDAMQAAETGAWLHTECARSFGPGLIAEDLPEELPKVLQGLGI